MPSQADDDNKDKGKYRYEPYAKPSPSRQGPATQSSSRMSIPNLLNNEEDKSPSPNDKEGPRPQSPPGTPYTPPGVSPTLENVRQHLMREWDFFWAPLKERSSRCDNWDEISGTTLALYMKLGTFGFRMPADVWTQTRLRASLTTEEGEELRKYTRKLKNPYYGAKRYSLPTEIVYRFDPFTPFEWPSDADKEKFRKGKAVNDKIMDENGKRNKQKERALEASDKRDLTWFDTKMNGRGKVLPGWYVREVDHEDLRDPWIAMMEDAPSSVQG
ncbi:hypothetical protein K491DRAFT_683596 [Lophiostoma macrostomum CBS 122681]|uniref:Uncharacterized protein n=1 Tax=Lophiostoma macrostomum CBS 122681 TaxID=1314788 RepID=A0A6A6SPC8_9PLEO|nr:hypothetical protein K491DRAFT_683596 [Lophiostoma macrostomum CBS 122681]